MLLVADRFLEDADGMLDIVTTARVQLRRLPPLADGAEERAWMAARDGLAAVWHECLPPLVDFGLLADKGRFEAYGARSASAWSRGDAAAAVAAFLAECGLATRASVRVAGRPRSGPGRAAIGVRIVEPPALQGLADVLERSQSGAPARLGCTAPPGSGWRTFTGLSARVARRHGFIAVDANVLRARSDLSALIQDRHVLLIDRDGCATAERLLLALAMRSARGHVLLVRMRDARAAAELRLSPMEPAALRRLVHLWPADRRARARLARAAAQSGGWPARLVASLRETSEAVPGTHRVAEAREEYVTRPAVGPPQTDRGEASTIRRVEAVRTRAAQLVAAGRHAAAERLLRETAASWRRRDAPVAAARLDLSRGWLLLSRGRSSAAHPLFREAHTAFEAAEDREVTGAAAGEAAALTSDGALESSEAILRAARACTVGRERDGRLDRSGSHTALGLARCLYWQGRLEAAERALADPLNGDHPESRAMALCWLGRVALARPDLPNAGRAASLALAEVPATDMPVVASIAHEVLLGAHGRLSDAAGVALHGTEAVAWAVRARRPLRLLHARASVLDARQRCRERLDRRLLARLENAGIGTLPGLTRARLAAVLARVHPDSRERAAWAARVAAFVGTSGARLLVADATEPPGARLARDTGALLDIVERHPDPGTLPSRVCDWLRSRVQAVAVAALDVHGAPVGSTGECRAFESAARVLATRQVQPPWTSAQGLEAGAPIISHGGLVGTLVVRWVVTREIDAGVTALLATAAACLGPALRVYQDRQDVEVAARDAGHGPAIIGRSPAVVRLRDAIDRAARSPFPVLIAGESGAGKELVGRALHAGSPRRARAFCAINCAALMDDLLEAELFGHTRGAFTGAHADRPGLFEQADGGTLFLDEVGELSARAQAKLLRVLQDGEIRRVGENAARRVDVRIVAATNRLLDADVREGRFRQDLLFRLAVVRLIVPPLRDRREDIPLLAVRFWQDAVGKTASRATLTAQAVGALAQHVWPGNVRELQNVMAALAVHVPRGRVGAADVTALTGATAAPAGDTLQMARRRFEREFVGAVLARCGGRQGAAARDLGLTRQGLSKLLRRLATDPDADGVRLHENLTSEPTGRT